MLIDDKENNEIRARLKEYLKFYHKASDDPMDVAFCYLHDKLERLIELHNLEFFSDWIDEELE